MSEQDVKDVDLNQYYSELAPYVCDLANNMGLSTRDVGTVLANLMGDIIGADRTLNRMQARGMIASLKMLIDASYEKSSVEGHA